MTIWLNFPADLSSAPSQEGIYLLSETASNSGIVYVGRADKLNERLPQHRDPENPCLRRKTIRYFAYETTKNSERIERQLIDLYNPECNRQ